MYCFRCQDSALKSIYNLHLIFANLIFTIIFVFFICPVLIFGCGDEIISGGEPQLSVSPLSVVFPIPNFGETTAEVNVEISNPGSTDLIISSVELTESDPLTEVIILDRADWTQGNTVIAAGVSRDIQLQWSTLDAQADRAVLTISSNAGVVEVNIETPDLDPVLRLTAPPWGDISASNTSISIQDTPPDGAKSIHFTIHSEGVVPLTLEQLCFVGGQEVCLEGQESGRGSFRLCDGSNATSNCLPPELPPDSLLSGESYSFSILYRPAANSVDHVASQVLISSDAGSNPRHLFRLIGEPCVRSMEGDLCALCGDGVIDEGEECDDGNIIDVDACTNTCLEPRCGDGIIQEGEECDDAQENSDERADACRTDCQQARCGDGVVDQEEGCDDTSESAACNADCTLTECGDGVLNISAGEMCDDTSQASNACPYGERVCVICDLHCQEVVVSGLYCGDGLVSAEHDEECDDQNQTSETCPYGERECVLCNEDCQEVVSSGLYCGDGVVSPEHDERCDHAQEEGEVCPYGERECVVCDERCQEVMGMTSYCGDGIINGMEECDGGGSCSDQCTLQIETKLVFLTSRTHSGNFGGVSGADAFCQESANLAGLSGTFKAWLSARELSSSPSARFTRSTIPYVRTDGVQIAADWNDLTDGSIQAPIVFDEYGDEVFTSQIYSFTMTDGTPGLFGRRDANCYGGDCHCEGWTNDTMGETSNGTVNGSAVGRIGFTDDDWTDYSFGNFCRSALIYCFEQ